MLIFLVIVSIIFGVTIKSSALGFFLKCCSSMNFVFLFNRCLIIKVIIYQLYHFSITSFFGYTFFNYFYFIFFNKIN